VNSRYAVYEKAHEGFADSYPRLLGAGAPNQASCGALKPFGLDARKSGRRPGGLT